MNNQGDETARSAMNQSGSASGISGAGPEFIYFYYIKKKAGRPEAAAHASHDSWELRVFFEKSDSENHLSEQKIRELISDADGGRLCCLGDEMQDVELKHKSYMLFVWKEYNRELKNVHFILQSDHTKKDYSFEEFSRTKMSPDISVVAYINTRKDKHGGPLGNKSETFEVEFETKPEFMRLHNENTTNTGP
jgi:hypothetical protein